MSRIRAFVGHSFTDDDAGVVRAFLEYFDQLERSHSTFTWEHAEVAEPKELADKVLRLMDDKNVFIGICTKKERVVDARALKATFLPTGSLRAPADAFEWKTSDWIVQEIGVACGRKMDLVLLIERGVRPPGGLQGNVEYISFDRDAPEKAFGKFVEMVAALSPKPPTLGAIDATVSPATGEAEAPDLGEEWDTPAADWKREDYEFALLRAVLSKSGDEIAIALVKRTLRLSWAPSKKIFRAGRHCALI